MNRGWVGAGVKLLLLVVIAALVAGQLLGQPILLSYVETGSMAPTLEPGDGFIAIPAAVSGEIESGDVVVFEATDIGGGGLTTHRIVDETDRGYVTRGDANPFTDQSGGEPHVQDGQIVATALQVNGKTVPLPLLGTIVMGISGLLETAQIRLATVLGTRSVLGGTGLAYIGLAFSMLAYTFEAVRERRGSSFESRLGREDSWTPDPHLVSVALTLVIVVAATMAMVAPAGTQSFGVVSAEFESDQPLVIESGTTEHYPYVIGNGGYVPVVTYVEPASEGIDVQPQRATVSAQDEAELTLLLTAPPETGYYPMYTTEYRYLYVLPRPIIGALYTANPWLPTLVILGILGGGTYTLGRLVLGSGDVRARRSRDRDSRTRSILQRFY